MRLNIKTATALWLGAGLLLVGCGGGGGSSHHGGDNTVEGNAKGQVVVGQALVGKKVTAHCADGETYSGTSGKNGAFGIDVPVSETTETDAFPCVLSVEAGTVGDVAYGTLHAVITKVGETNVTPISELALSKSLLTSFGVSNANDWLTELFESESAPRLATLRADEAGVDDSESDAEEDDLSGEEGADEAPIETDSDVVDAMLKAADGLETAVSALKEDLTAAGYKVPKDVGLTGKLNPVAGDELDDMLEALARALKATGATFTEMVASIMAGGDFPMAPEEPRDPATPPANHDVPAVSGQGAALKTAVDGETYTLNQDVSFTDAGPIGYTFMAHDDNGTLMTLTIPAEKDVDGGLTGFPLDVGTYDCQQDAFQFMITIMKVKVGAGATANYSGSGSASHPGDQTVRNCTFTVVKRDGNLDNFSYEAEFSADIPLIDSKLNTSTFETVNTDRGRQNVTGSLKATASK